MRQIFEVHRRGSRFSARLQPFAVFKAFFSFPSQGEFAALRGPRVISGAPLRLQKKATFILIFFKGEITPVLKKTVSLRKGVNIHLEIRGKTLSVPACEIHKTGLFATDATLAALKIRHKKRARFHRFISV